MPGLRLHHHAGIEATSSDTLGQAGWTREVQLELFITRLVRPSRDLHSNTLSLNTRNRAV